MLDLPLVIDGRYRLDRHVGTGGFGDVYAGSHLALDTPVAVKILDLVRHGDPRVREHLQERFLEEGRMLTKLRHPNIVAALDFGVLDPGPGGHAAPYLVMEWVDGRTLERYLSARSGALSVEEAWAIFEPALEALACAHEARVVHRDLKPANIMVVPGPKGAIVPRIIDFGIAKIMAPDEEPGSGATETAHPGGAFTPAYAAPEQIAQARTGPWTDVHALGLLFVELVTGKLPYGTGTPARLAAIDPDRPTPLARGVDVGAMEAVIARAVALRPRDRFADAGAMLDAARTAIAGVPTPAIAESAPEPSAATPARLAGSPEALPTLPRTQQRAVDPASTPTLRSDDGAAPAPAQRRADSPVDIARTLPAGYEPPRAGAPRSRRSILLGGVVASAAAAWLLFGRRTPAPRPAGMLEAGGLHWRVQSGSWREDSGSLVGSGGQVYSETILEDVVIDLDVEVVGDRRAARSVGVGFRAQPANDPADGSGYALNFRPGAGTFNVLKGTDGDWRGLDPAFPTYHPSPAVRAGANHVAIRAAARAFTIDLNGERLASFEDGAYPKGRITLWVESTAQTVRFSRIHVVAS